MSKMENLIIVSEFAKAVGVTSQAVHVAMKKGRIKNFRRIGPIYFIPKSQIQAFKESRR